MDINYQSFIPADFHPGSRVWVYQSSRVFLISEAFEIENILKEFTEQWLSHGTPVKGYANLLFGQFLVFMADETATGVSGCSTDSSVRVVKTIEDHFKVSMFDRQQLAFVVKDKIQLIPLAQFSYAWENNFIDAETLYFNNLVSTKEELMEKWLIPVKESWLKARMKVISN